MAQALPAKLLGDLMSGKFYGVFIDDTGSPGLNSSLPPLDPERKTWVAVLVQPSDLPQVLRASQETANEIRELIGVSELHFTDIVSGKNEFRNVSVDTRLTLFELMSEIFRLYKFPIFVQTFDPSSLDNLRLRQQFPRNLGPFDFGKPADVSLLFLLIMLRKYVEKNRKDKTTKAHIFIDEGYKKSGLAISVPFWSDVFADGNIKFVSSSRVHLIQLADFAAFAINRQKMVLRNDKLSSIDQILMRLISNARLNAQNIPGIELDPDDWSNERSKLLDLYQKAEDKVGIRRNKNQD
jgi:hypothetical protein